MNILRVLTLNTWNREGPYSERLPLLRAWIRRLEPDLIGFQEVERDQVAELLEGFEYRSEWAGHGASGVAVASRWPIVECASSDLPGTDASSVGGIVLGCRVEAPFGTVPFANATTYFPMLHEGWKRERQMPSLAQAARRLRTREGFPVVLVGDFNAEPETTEIRYLKGLQALDGGSAYFCDAWERAGDGSDGATWTQRNPYSAKWGLHDRRIDYVFVGVPGVCGPGAVRSCRVVCDRPVGGVWPSDHLGVLAELSVA